MRLDFRMEGPALRDGLPLDMVNESMTSLQLILERSYLVYQGRERISREEREVFQMRLRTLKSGSLAADLELLVNMTQAMLPVVAALSPNVLWEYTKATFAFLKVVFQAAKRGEQPQYRIGDDNSTHVTIGEVHHHYNGPVLQIARMAVPQYRKLQNLIDDGSVTTISLAADRDGQPDVGISLSPADRRLFNVPSTVERQPVDIRCEVFDFNKFENKGKTSVAEGQPIPAGKYPFRVIGRQDPRPFIQSMLEPSVCLTCLRELRVDPIGETTIARLHVLAIKLDGPAGGIADTLA